jgi:hypothetical protein
MTASNSEIITGVLYAVNREANVQEMINHRICADLVPIRPVPDQHVLRVHRTPMQRIMDKSLAIHVHSDTIVPKAIRHHVRVLEAFTETDP